MWVATQDLPRSAAHPFYIRLNQILDQYDFDGYVEALCQQFYADDGRPGLPQGRYFRLLLIGYFGGQPAALRCMKSVICIGQCFGACGSRAVQRCSHSGQTNTIAVGVRFSINPTGCLQAGQTTPVRTGGVFT